MWMCVDTTSSYRRRASGIAIITKQFPRLTCLGSDSNRWLEMSAVDCRLLCAQLYSQRPFVERFWQNLIVVGIFLCTMKESKADGAIQRAHNIRSKTTPQIKEKKKKEKKKKRKRKKEFK